MIMASEPIAVLGATGRTGGATVRSLCGQGLSVRALTRDPHSQAAKTIGDLGAEVVAADMDNEASLKQALEGTTRLFNVQPAFDDRGRYQGDLELAQGAAVAGAAAAVGIEHVVQLAAGRGEPTGLAHFDAKLTIRRGFEDRGIAVTALHPGPFMELMVDPSFAPALSVWGVEPRIVGWDRPLPWVSLEDIGGAAADALAGPVPSDGATIELIGDSRSLRECRELLSAAGRRPRRVPIPIFLFRAMVGDEFIQMWQWITTIEGFPITPGLLDVSAWIEQLERGRETHDL
jgi:uncharacterized protein YbjT (DUF2867 family)